MSAAELAMPTFYGQHRAKLPKLFEITGVPAEAADSLETAVAATQPWARGDHIKPEQRFQIDLQDEAELRRLFDELGLVREHDLLSRHYDEILMLGGTYWGSKHRLQFLGKVLEEGGVTTDRMTLLGGEREIFDEELPVVLEDLEQLDMDQFLDMEDGAGGTDIYWETDMLRLAAVKELGGISMKQEYIEIGDGPGRPHVQEFSWSGIPFSLMHTKAVERNGKSRHTTEACVVDWLQTTEPKRGMVVGIIAANPHTTRIGRAAYAMLERHGRGDIVLLPAGPAVLPTVQHHTYLGEIARHLYEDKRLTEARSGLLAGAGMAGQPGVTGQ